MWKAPFGFIPQLGNAVLAHSLTIIIVQDVLGGIYKLCGSTRGREGVLKISTLLMKPSI